ncbi:MAG: homoserine kinase [Clostridia bacterium]|nr:homoserine kinase [Clostridia bacterium]
MISVRVPASTANLGSGFDCMGIALKLYTEAKFEETDSGLEINILDSSRDFLPCDDTNYVYRAMKRVFDKAGKYPKGIRITSHTDIPITRGLGSSSASLALGLCGANELIGTPFSHEELLQIAYDIEGHPDNVTPAFFGGFTVAVNHHNRVIYTKTEVPENIRFAAMIPEFYLATKRARGILPKTVLHKNAAFNIAHAAYFASAAAKGDFSAFDVGVKDKIHQKYRFELIGSAEFIIRSAKRYGAMCGYLSGAGPTIISVVDKNHDEFTKKMKGLIATNLKNWKLVMLEPDNTGVVITHHD